MKKVAKRYENLTISRFYMLIVFMIISVSGFSQNVGINTTGTAPNTNAGLDVDFSDKGVLIPRIALSSTTSFSPLSAHVAGMLVYNTATSLDVIPGFYYNNGSVWIPGFPAASATGTMLYWNGSAWMTIPVGLPGQYLQLNGGLEPYWGGTAVLATLSTTTASLVTGITATTGGNITADNGLSVLSRGICYASTTNPTTANTILVASPATGIGAFTSNLTGLAPVTTYYARAYATNNSVTSYGNQITFTTLPILPTVTSTAASSITGSTATSGGNVTSDGGSTITERGITYSTASGPTILTGTKIINGSPSTGTFSSNISGLTGGTTYYVRAYATNSIGTSYGTQIIFTTLVVPPTLVTVAASSIGGASAVSGGSMSWNGPGYSNYHYYGVCYSTVSGSASPTYVNTNTNNYSYSTPIAPWVTSLTGLAANTTYYIRSFLYVYKAGWSYVYGDELSFTTAAATTPIIGSTTAITGISSSTASSGGTITSDGGSSITAKGVCWGTSPNPTLGVANFTTNGTGTGAFSSNLTGLSGSTIYYVRSYATNAIGTSYGPVDVSFTTFVTPIYTLGQFVGYGNVAYIAPDGTGFIVSPDIALSGASWGCSGTSIATGTAIGTGKANTDLILATCATRPIAASLAKAYAGGGFNDWYLPSSGEFARIAATYTSNGSGSVSNSYYTSSQSTTTYAVSYFSNYNQPYTSGSSKAGDGYTNSIRAIRDFAASPAVAPTVISTTAITSETATGGASGGYISSDGGATVSARGVCWSSIANPTIADSKTTNGTGMGSFTSSITGLTTGTPYYVRAYATNTAGTTYGPEISFTPVSPGFPSVISDTVSSIGATTATSGGNVTSEGGGTVTARGVCWSTLTSPTTADSKTTDGTGTGTFVSSITGLTSGTLYYVRAYATNATGTTYGAESSFTPFDLATLTTDAITNLSTTSVTTGGNITTENGSAVTARGVCWSTLTAPTTANSKTTDGTGSGVFVSSVTGLTPNTLYYVRAYATNGAGTAYGDEVNFTTVALALPTVTTDAISNLLGTSATTGGNVTADGGDPVSTRGVTYGTNPNPDANVDMVAYDTASGLGAFVIDLTGLTNGQQYYARAFAINNVGIAYGDDVIFTPTGDGIPTLTTATITNPSPTGGTSGGEITTDGGQLVTARGVCWSDLNYPPTIADSKTVDGSGTGTFASTITGLTTAYGYYVCAYATNSLGTAYGQVEYYVPVGLPTVTTEPLYYTAPETTATSGVNVSSDGGDPLTALGIVWATTSGPTVGTHLGITSENLINGWWSQSTLTGLAQSTTYYVRAYATNSIGTSYGAEISFTPGVVGLPTVLTGNVKNSVGAIAEIETNILSDGGDAVITSGICWSTTADPTIDANPNITVEYISSGLNYSIASNLTIGTTYHVRAYATNGIGTAYGADVSFIATAATMGQVVQGGNLFANVFSVDGTGLHGLMAYPYEYLSTDWGCTSSTVGTGTAIGTGFTNTAAMVADNANNSCSSATAPNYTFAAEVAQWWGPDWYLPSKDEFTLLWTNRVAAGITGFSSATFPAWSSSEFDATHAWSFNGTNWISTNLKTAQNMVWVIRSF